MTRMEPPHEMDESNAMSRSAVERIVVGMLVAGFAIGTTTHVLHLVNLGWIVFDAAPAWMNVYWATLTALDPLAAVLLLYHRPTGLRLGAAIIVSDVAINSYALYGLGLPFGFLSLQLQTVFCGFLLGAAGFLMATRVDKPKSATAVSTGIPNGSLGIGGL